MKRCYFCDTDNADDAKYCKECGRALDHPLTELSEREILLQVKYLLDRGLKQREEHQREYRQYMEEYQQNIEKFWQKERKEERIRWALTGFLIALIVFVLASALI